MVNLPLNDGLYIRDFINKYRMKNNISEPEELKKVYNKQTTFLEEELKLVTKLRITKELFPYLDYFPNLTIINITGSESLSQFEIQLIINKYPNLKELTIEHQDYLQFIDLNNLSKLQRLKIISNKELKSIIGFNNMNDLYSFICYDNQAYNHTLKQDLFTQIYRFCCELGTKCTIDVLYMPDFIKFLEQNNLNLNDVKDFITWREKLKIGVEVKRKYLEYKTNELYMAYKKAKIIVDRYIKATDTPRQKFAILYQWMCENIKYDCSALDNEHTHIKDKIVQGQHGGSNGTVNALMYGSCVCQGYTKSMQLLLKILEIYSADVECVVDEKNENQKSMLKIDNQIHGSESNHSILRVNLDGVNYYSDITWDANRYQNGKNRVYFLLSKFDISKDHRLLGEDKIINIGKSVSFNEQEELLRFASERIRKINEKIKKTGINEQENYKNLVHYVEKLLNYKIFFINDYVFDSYTKFPKIVLKNPSILRQEKIIIYQKLDKLYYDGKLNHELWQLMKKAIKIEYDKMILLVLDSKYEEDNQKLI